MDFPIPKYRNIARFEGLCSFSYKFDQLSTRKDVIEKAFGGTLSWERLDTKRACRIKHVIERGGYRSPESQWPEIQAEMVDTMIKLESVLKPALESLGL